MKLQKEVSAKYKLVGIQPGRYQFADYGLIDLTTLTLSEADNLHSIGFPYLQKLKKEVPSK